MKNELAVREIVDGYTMKDLTVFASITTTYGYDAVTLELVLKNSDNTDEDGKSFGISLKALSNQSNVNHRKVIALLSKKGFINNKKKTLTRKGFFATNQLTKEALGKLPDPYAIRPLLEYRKNGWRVDRTHKNFTAFWTRLVDEIKAEEEEADFNTSLKQGKHPLAESTTELIKGIINGV